jgi:phosphoribosylaminoimidazole-succinocarboxamide synthase
MVGPQARRYRLGWTSGSPRFPKRHPSRSTQSIATTSTREPDTPGHERHFDFKIECGFDRETGALLVADVIDSDSGRLRFGDRDMSKQAYRDGSQSLPDIKKNFDEVAELTKQFG